jgi:RimJ/RimL family protein N-acetyltransferase
MSEFVQPYILDDPTAVLFAMFDKTRSDKTPESEMEKTFAGVIAYILSSPSNLSTEIGMCPLPFCNISDRPLIRLLACVTTLPSFQRTHVTSNACGLLLQYALSLPSSTQPGLGLRRVQWQTNCLNAASIDCAKRLGFKFEGIKRWDRVLPKGKDLAGNGGGVREGDSKEGCVGRDSALLSLCWDDWEGGERERIQKTMDRKL